MEYKETIQCNVGNMTDFEKSVYEDICSWAKKKHGGWVDPTIDFENFRDQYWKEKLHQ